jgi:hypothetical protein
MRKSAFVLLLGLLAAGLAWPQAQPELWPGAKYDPAVPTLRQVLGYDTGGRITSHEDIVKYLEALAARTGRLRLFDYGKSWEGRRLVYAAVASETNIKRLEQIRADMQRLADPRKTPEAEARKIMASLPAVIWLAYGVHGNEISSPDAALMTAYHLIASREDPVVENILANTVVLIDPQQNPDGRDRFVHNFEQASGLEPDANPMAAEHSEPWPGGRGNHYYFDMNRDWISLTQPEISSQMKVLLQWFPLVCLDAHEMGADSTYYFAPPADPANPHLAKEQAEELVWFGKNNAKWFDRFGFDYFVHDQYDAFYPGYGDSWPRFYGAVAMTYENATSRGLLMRRSDETVLSFRDTVRKHFVASISTAQTAAENRQKLLENFYRYRQTAIEEGSSEPIREYILPRAGDTSAVDKLAGLLAEQGVEVRQAKAAFRNGSRDYPAGSYTVSLAQPAKRLIRVLLDTNVPMDEAFVKEQERRRQKKLGDEVYDVTAWSLPLMFNVEAVASAEVSKGSFEAVSPKLIPPGTVFGGRAEVAYLAPGGTLATMRLLAASLRAGLRVLASDKPFTVNGKRYPAGTLIFKVKDNRADLPDTLAKLAASSGATVEATNTSWVDEGANFGSRYVSAVPKTNIAIAWDTPTSGSAAGATRFVIERQYGYPTTPIRSSQLGSADLSRFNVLILPDGNASGYAQTLGTGGINRLKEWVASGGTIVAIGGALGFLADQRVGLLATQQETVPRPTTAPGERRPEQAGAGAGEQRRPEAAAPAGAAPAGAAPAAAAAEGGRVPGKLLATEEDYARAIQADSDLPDRALGVLIRARLDPDHWLTAGLPETVTVLASGREIYTPLKLDRGVNTAVFAGPDQLLLSGYLWEETRKQFARKPFVMVQRNGRGQVIAFTEDPNFRAYLDGLNVLFLNAVFRGPAHARTTGRGEQIE